MRCPRLLYPAYFILLAGLPAFSQSVISVHSGVVHFSEGAVFIDDRPLDQKSGTFASVKEGSTLKTGQGRAEVLLTPGVVLRLDENSSFRMTSASITGTRLEFLGGSMIIDSLDAPTDSPVVVSYQACDTRFAKPGIYRFDSDPAALLQVYKGEAEVAYDGKTSSIDTSHLFFFAAGTETKKFDDGTDDKFYAWAKERADAISAENQLAAQTGKDPADMDDGQYTAGYPNYGGLAGLPGYGGGGPTYAPLTGIYSANGAYLDSYAPYGVGFFGAYPMFVPVYVPVRYYRNSLRSRWPARPSYPILSSSGTGIQHYPPLRTPLYVPHTVSPGIGPVRSTLPRTTTVPAPRANVSVGVHPIGHR